MWTYVGNVFFSLSSNARKQDISEGQGDPGPEEHKGRKGQKYSGDDKMINERRSIQINGCGLTYDTVLVFAWRNWVKPR
jgi:hypothetical protein